MAKDSQSKEGREGENASQKWVCNFIATNLISSTNPYSLPGVPLLRLLRRRGRYNAAPTSHPGPKRLKRLRTRIWEILGDKIESEIGRWRGCSNTWFLKTGVGLRNCLIGVRGAIEGEISCCVLYF
ncbi:hypothetical protein CCACVL1_06794 [Corchorus capsularis]|uniref:Uncharacterized protein n=1 Tax=Corchorus capsularis TaxID=210143 RepID=A0A1R3JCY0_COCAP|nr:hypothetical protein CCACVL1_06794 [Corchorus capsularis]